MHHRRARAAVLALPALAACVAACGAAPESRFALRAPVTREDDDRPFERRPERSDDLEMPYSVDVAALRPLSHATLLERDHDARNVNALDEVPDSTWYTNRAPTPEELAAGPCRDVPAPVLPLTITSSKQGGATPGYFVRDATGRRFALKLDQRPARQPGLSTTGDVVGSRLYWGLGYNAPCNVIGYYSLADLRIGRGAYYTDELAIRHPLDMDHVRRMLGRTLPPANGPLRFGVSTFVPGEILGPWSGEGTRDDDPNDRIPHEDRRELRGERLLGAWLNRWDARNQNSLDVFVRAPGATRGYVRHYQLDFGDVLGTDSGLLEDSGRLGFTYTFHPSVILGDLFSFGAVHRPWDETVHDPAAPMLTQTFDVAHFDPATWVPANPSPRYDAATDQDLAWMARKIARLGPEHLAAVLATAHLPDPVVTTHLLAILMGRRARALRWSFARVSPLADLAVRGGATLCATDLALTSGVAEARATAYAAAFEPQPGPGPRRVGLLPREGRVPGEVCVVLPPHRAPERSADDSAARYRVVDLVRVEAGRQTVLRAHLYDLGPERGYVLVGIERPS